MLKPRKLIDPQQAWFWSEAWQAREREAQEAIDAERVKRFSDPDELLHDLNHGDLSDED